MSNLKRGLLEHNTLFIEKFQRSRTRYLDMTMTCTDRQLSLEHPGGRKSFSPLLCGLLCFFYTCNVSLAGNHAAPGACEAEVSDLLFDGLSCVCSFTRYMAGWQPFLQHLELAELEASFL